MSMIMSFATPDAALLLTDAGVWNIEDQKITDLKRKVYTAKSVPLAVTARGPSPTVDNIGQYICDWADIHGAEAMIDGLQRFADTFHRQHGVWEGRNGFMVLVAAWLPGVGGVHRQFRSYAAGERRPYEVVTPGDTFVAGTTLSGADLIAAGAVKGAAEPVQDFVRRCGADIMEIVRRRPMAAKTGEMTCMVGGWCDLTTIDAAGARTETLRTWPDEIGAKIDPLRVAPVGNRRQRRAARSAAG